MDAEFWQALLLTFELAAITTLILLVLGVPLALFLNRRRGAIITILEAVVSLPIVLPPTVLGFYLLVLLSPARWPGSAWQALFSRPLTFSFPGLVVGSLLYSLPFAVQPFQAAFRNVPQTILEAAALEARPAQVFWYVHLPVAARGLLVGISLAFAHTVGEFGVVLMVGGNIPGQTRVASIALYDEVQKLNYDVAHRYAFVLLAISFCLLLLVSAAQRRSRILD
jgi:molybdate transport system permease protein